MTSPETCHVPRRELRIVRFENPDEHARELPQFDQRYCQTGPGRFAGTLVMYPTTGGVDICRETINVPLVQQGMLRPGARMFGVPLTKARNSTYQGVLMSDAIAQLAGGQPFEVHSRGATDYVMVSIDDDVFAGYAEYLGGLPALDWLSQPILHLPRAARERTSAEVAACVAAVTENPGYLRFDNARKALREEVMGSLLHLLVDAMPSPRPDVTHLSYANVVRRSREYVLSHPYEAISVLDLCRLLRISRRTLQTSFQQVSGVAPSTYLRAVRLAAVRTLLRETPTGELSIADAAARWGFLHASKFATGFRNMFGLSPSQVRRPRGRGTEAIDGFAGRISTEVSTPRAMEFANGRSEFQK